jgi:hypothetical protein
MHKKIFLFNLLLITSLLYSMDLYKSDLDIYKIKGKVRTWEHKTVDFKNGQIDVTSDKFIKKFDNNKNLIELERLIISNKKEYYDNIQRKYVNNKCIEILSFDKNLNQISNIDVKYDENNNITELDEYNNSKILISKRLYKYDSTKNILIFEYNPIEKLKQKIIIKLNENNNELENCCYDENDKILYKWVYTYDKIGNIIDFKNYNENRLSLNYKTIYNNQNQEIFSKWYNNLLLDCYSFTFYFKNKIINIVYNNNGSRRIKNIYYLDKNGNKVKHEEYLFNKTIYKYELMRLEEDKFDYF